MDENLFDKTVKMICERDNRYDPEAYYFLRDALSFTCKMLNKPEKGNGRHVSGKELLEGIRLFALQEFGPMALTVINSWGVFKTEDFGEIVFNLVESGSLGKSEEDKKSDFVNGYDFHQAFVTPFLPKSKEHAFLQRKKQTTHSVKRRKEKKL